MSTKTGQAISWGGAATTSANAAVPMPDYVPYRVSQPSASLSVSCNEPPTPVRRVKLRLRITALVDEVVAQIMALGALQSGWNSYRAGQISAAAQSRAAAFVGLLANRDMRIRMPSVAPTSDGGVSLHWDVDNREIDIVFTEDGQEFSVTGRGRDKILDGGSIETLEQLKDVLRSYFPV